MRVFAFYMHRPAWLHSDSAVPLCSWMSTCLSVARPLLRLSASLWTSVYFLLHQSSWLQTPPTPHPHDGHKTPLLPGRPSPPLSRVSPRHQLWTTYAYPAVHLMQPCHISGQHGTLSETVALLCSLYRFAADPQTSHLNTVCSVKPVYIWEVLHMAKWERYRQMEFWIHPLFSVYYTAGNGFQTWTRVILYWLVILKMFTCYIVHFGGLFTF